jgi:hypothetical protein
LQSPLLLKQPDSTTPVAIDTAKTLKAPRFAPQPIEIQHYRPQDRRGLNMFEAPKEEGVAYNGFKLSWGAAFTQQYQSLSHSNTATAKPVTTAGVTTDANKLIEIGSGFNNAVANLYMNAQIARGIRVSLNSNLSSRHHNETWVNDGYLLIDASPFDVQALNKLMNYLTLRVGHFDINYGDAHFRRSANGNAMYNPFVGNYIMDAYTTEIGAEAYLRANGWLAMAGVTGGEIRGQVTKPNDRSMTYLGKLGYDKQLSPELRVRLTGSTYAKAKSVSNTLFSGDRAGSRYYDVLENTTSTESAQAWSGAIQPGFKSSVHAIVFNPFVKFRGLELFGNIEQAKGKAANELTNRTWRQNVGEAVYRFAADQLYVGGRYNTAKGSARWNRQRREGESLPGWRRLVRDAQRPYEGRVCQPEVPRFPEHRYSQRWQVQRYNDRGSGGVLAEQKTIWRIWRIRDGKSTLALFVPDSPNPPNRFSMLLAM